MPDEAGQGGRRYAGCDPERHGGCSLQRWPLNSDLRRQTVVHGFQVSGGLRLTADFPENFKRVLILAVHDEPSWAFRHEKHQEEKKERLQARLDNPNKRWKFSKGDLDERLLWDH